MTLRRWLMLCCGLLFAVTASAMSPATADDLRWIDRLTGGVTSADVARLEASGREAFLAEQLVAGPPLLTPEAEARVRALARLQRPVADALAGREARGEELKAIRANADARRAAGKALREEDAAVLRETGERLLLRAVYAGNGLQEQLAWFWFNHFNVYAGKAQITWLLADYEDALRPHLTGNFRDLVRASMLHPAMLRYLDNRRSKKGKINENYARELLELHTLGVDGGYTQRDVQELARVLTGVSLVPGGGKDRAVTREPGYRRFGMVEFNPRQHDSGDKRLLGTTVRGGGWEEIEGVLDLLARHPSTARHVSRRLALYFVDDAPPDALVARMAAAFTESGGNLRRVLETLFASPEFAAAAGRKHKSSWQYLVSALRAAGLPPDAVAPMLAAARQLAQPPYEQVTPDGYSLAGNAWRSPGQLESRLALARDIALQAEARGVLDPAGLERLLPMLGDAQRARVLAEPDPRRRLMLFLGAPEFMYR